jgi:hypothetical protein
VIPLAEREVALFSIWIQPLSVLPSKSAVAGFESASAWLTLIAEWAATAVAASLTKSLRLRRVGLMRILRFLVGGMYWDTVGEFRRSYEVSENPTLLAVRKNEESSAKVK